MRIWMILIPLVLALSALAHQDDAQDTATEREQETPPQTQPDAKALWEERTAVWELQARYVAHRLELSEEVSEKVRDAYVQVRRRHAEAAQEMRIEWLERMLALAREGQGGNIFDRTELERDLVALDARERQRLAEALIEIVEKEHLRPRFPFLAAFDPKVDGMVKEVAGFELEEDVTFKAIESLDEYVLNLDQARRKRRESREAMAAALEDTRTELQASLGRILTPEQVKIVVAVIGVDPDRPRRGGEGDGGR